MNDLDQEKVRPTWAASELFEWGFSSRRHHKVSPQIIINNLKVDPYLQQSMKRSWINKRPFWHGPCCPFESLETHGSPPKLIWEWFVNLFPCYGYCAVCLLIVISSFSDYCHCCHYHVIDISKNVGFKIKLAPRLNSFLHAMILPFISHVQRKQEKKKWKKGSTRVYDWIDHML